MIKRNKARLARYYRAGLIALLLLGLMAWAWIPGVSDFLHGSLAAFTTLDQHALENFIRSYGTQAAVVSFFLMILQAIVASWSSAMAGAALCFFIARILGRGAVEKLTGKTVLNNMDAFFERYGKHTILVCRLLPFVPFDPVSYAAGLTSIRFRHFFIATGIGQLPATIVYSWAGSLLTGGTFWFVTGLFVLFALSVVISIARSLYLERQRKKS